MKKIAFFILFFFTTILFAATTAVPVPDQSFLVKNDFYFSCCGIGGSELKFLKNNNYMMSYNIDGGSIWHNEGNYEIAGKNILLRPVTCYQEKGGPAIDCKETIGETVCRLEKNDDSVHYSRYVTCRPKLKQHAGDRDAFEYPVKDSAVKAGEKKRVDGIAVIALGEKQAVTTSNVKLRAKPSASAKEIEFRLYPDYRSPFVPAKTEITVYARTEKKEKVQNWENYWYYVKAGMSYDGKGAWMFGEFIRMK